MTDLSEDNRYKKLVLAAGIASVGTALLLIAMKFCVWFLSGSSSILASLMDSTIDLGASFINLLAMRYAIAPPDREHRFGHYKAEALSSLCQAAFIGGSAFFLIMQGIERLRTPKVITHIDAAIYVSIASICITVLLVYFQAFVVRATKSQAVGADRYHYLSDVLLNLGVIGSLLCSRAGYLWADGLFAIVLGLFILKGAVHIGRMAVSTLLDRSMTQAENQQILAAILQVKGIVSLHDLKTRMAGPCCFVQCHLVMDPHIPLREAHNIATQAEDAVRAIYPDADITMHMEPDEADTYREVQFVDDTTCQADLSARSSNSKNQGASHD